MNRIGSLFSGYGGLDRGVREVFGGEVVWHAEINEAAKKVLTRHYWDIPNYGDVSEIEFSKIHPVDILVGGFPCQDVSLAGKRAGLRAGQRSSLWAHFYRAIRESRPRLVVIENVKGLLSGEASVDGDVEPCPVCLGDPSGGTLRALGAVLGDLADIGYDARWHCVRAADAGAPHLRGRVFIYAFPAYADGSGLEVARRLAQPAERSALVRDREAAPASSVLEHPTDWGDLEPVIEHWAKVIGRNPPIPTRQVTNTMVNPAFVEWMMGLPAGFIVDTPGLTPREQIELLGNGVVPQQAAYASPLFGGGPAAVAALTPVRGA